MRLSTKQLRAAIRNLRYGITAQMAAIRLAKLMFEHGWEDCFPEGCTKAKLAEWVTIARKQYAGLRRGEREARRRGIKVSPWESRSHVEHVLSERRKTK
jgi:hypothetical protein